ncbi:MAG TPA: transporter [Flavobacterium sp.]|nr:transporter [Flavobacterium sp.]
MRPFRLLALTISLLASAINYAQFTDVINSNRPGESMAAFSVGKTVIQAEAGIYGVDEKHKYADYEASGFGTDINLRYGAFLEQLEFILELQYQHDNFSSPLEHFKRNGFRQTIIGAKYLVYDPNKNYEKKPNLYSWKANHSFSWHEFIPAVGVYAGFNLQNLIGGDYENPDEGKATPKLMIMTQNQFGKYVFVTNLIADKFADKYQTFGFIITLTRGFNERWSGFVETQANKNDYDGDAAFRFGAAYLLKENFQLDASIGKNFQTTPSVFTAGIGVSWRFDDNYKEVLLRVPKDEKDKDKGKSKKDKKKEKEAKKRKDAVEGTAPTK